MRIAYAPPCSCVLHVTFASLILDANPQTAVRLGEWYVSSFSSVGSEPGGTTSGGGKRGCLPLISLLVFPLISLGLLLWNAAVLPAHGTVRARHVQPVALIATILWKPSGYNMATVHHRRFPRCASRIHSDTADMVHKIPYDHFSYITFFHNHPHPVHVCRFRHYAKPARLPARDCVDVLSSP